MYRSIAMHWWLGREVWQLAGANGGISGAGRPGILPLPHSVTTPCHTTSPHSARVPHSATVPHSVITKCNRVMVTGPHSTTVQLYHGGPTNQPTNHQQHHSATAPQYHITTVPQHHSATVICEAFVQYRALSCSAESASLWADSSGNQSHWPSRPVTLELHLIC